VEIERQLVLSGGVLSGVAAATEVADQGKHIIMPVVDDCDFQKLRLEAS